MRQTLLAAAFLLAALACRNQPLAPLPPASGKGLALALTLSRAGGCPLLFCIQDAGGATVVPAGGDWVCIAIVQVLMLPPGQHSARAFPWDTHSFAPGLYLAHGTFTGGGLQLATPRISIVLN